MTKVFSLSTFLLSLLCNLNCLRPQLVDMTAHTHTHYDKVGEVKEVRKGGGEKGCWHLISPVDFQSIASMFIVASNKSYAWLPIAQA